jgi:inorganic phosphate transporter, PiT family
VGAMSVLVLAVVLLLAWSNGSNDNFKGVATLYGSGTASYKRALAWATATQIAGSLLASALAAGLVAKFSARGLVPDAIASTPAFLGAAALGGGATVLIATLVGLPISTTHALTGALVGAGLVAGGGVNHGVLGKSFFVPLLVSPLLAFVLCAALYPMASYSRKRLGIEAQSCVCIGEEIVPLARAGGAAEGERVQLALAAGASCVNRYQGRVVGVSAQRALDVFHFVSAGAVCFARGLNDTPKIVALLVGAKAIGADVGLVSVGVAMAMGGVIGARRVAETMAKKITTLNAGQGLVSSVVTAVLVIFASRLSLPVSTTHVSNGGLFGIGAVTGTAKWKTIGAILLAWVTTLPLGAALGALGFLFLSLL